MVILLILAALAGHMIHPAQGILLGGRQQRPLSGDFNPIAKEAPHILPDHES